MAKQNMKSSRSDRFIFRRTALGEALVKQGCPLNHLIREAKCELIDKDGRHKIF